MNKTTALLLIILSGFLTRLHAQENKQFHENSLLISLGGEGGIYTIGYERVFKSKSIIRPFLHFGISAFPISQRLTVAIPISSGVLYNYRQYDFHVGAGIGPNVSYYYQRFSSGTSPSRLRFYSRGFLELGGRYRFKNDKFAMGIRYTPFISFLETFQFEHWGAVTFSINLNSKRNGK
jgi:hypothetical protein